MYADIPTIEKMLLPAIIIVVGFLVGVIFEKIILRKIKKLSSKKNGKVMKYLLMHFAERLRFYSLLPVFTWLWKVQS
jgi:prepilin signal peptidase PulO-like enzyme (type II secretory pathway)